MICRTRRRRSAASIHRARLTGWKLGDDPRILWSVDEVFDASLPAVANAARRYAQAHPEPSPPLGDSRRVLNSPRRFGHYTASAIWQTLPER